MMNATGEWSFLHRLLAVAVAAGMAVLVWQAAQVLFTAFSAILIAVLLSSLADALHRHLGLRRGLALGLVVVLLAAALGATGWLFGSQLGAQFGQIAQAVPASFRAIRGEMEKTVWGHFLLSQTPSLDLSVLLRGVTGIVGSALGLVADIVVILFAAVYLAVDPGLYRRGFLRLVPRAREARADEILCAAGEALRLWLAGQFVAMATIGVLAGIGLSLLGIPAALALGVIAALGEFIPIVGPVLGAVPAVVIGFAQGPMMAVWVALLYLVIQQTESNLLMPVIEQRMVSLPPVLTLFSTVTFGLLFGLIGVLFATPLTVVGMVLTQMLYVEDLLGKGPPDRLGSGR